MADEKSWADDMAADARARLQELGGLTVGDDSLRSGRAISAMRGLAAAISQMRPVDEFDPEGLANSLLMLADEFERVEQRFYLEKLGRLAA